MMTDS